jgi:DNA-binding NtrC family response regulator
VFRFGFVRRITSATWRQAVNGHAVLLVDKDEPWRRGLKNRLQREHIRVLESSAPSQLAAEFRRFRPAVIVVGTCPEEERTVLEHVRQIRSENGHIACILTTVAGSEALATAALRAGMKDYFHRPVPVDGIVARIQQCLGDESAERERLDTRGATEDPTGTGAMIGDSPVMIAIKACITRVAANDTNVLITGETGTGKELAAEMIHRNSPRRRKPLISINCAAIPDGLLESELFGHEAGAFTGAQSAKDGQLQLAEGGTVFFDEIGDMGSYAQAKILRVIEGKPMYRLGGRRCLPLNIRVVAATNQDLDRAMAEGRFRRDLYYRLNVARIHLPPLRERKQDIPQLVAQCVTEFNRRFHRDVRGCSSAALAGLGRYDWPGNVRELRNLLESVFVNLPSGPVSSIDLPEEFRGRVGDVGQTVPRERDRLVSALSATNWNKSKAAEQLHWSRMTLYRKMAKYQVTRSGPPESEDCNRPTAAVTPCDTTS